MPRKTRGSITQIGRNRYRARVKIVSTKPGEPPADKRRIFTTKTAAQDWIDSLLVKAKTNPRLVRHEKRTFSDLADYYVREYATAPEYAHDDVKVSGMRSWQSVVGRIEILRAYWGDTLLAAIEPEDLRRYKRERLAAPRQKARGDKTKRSAASVHRELSIMRAMLSAACELGWLSTNVFSRTKGLIQTSAEQTRMRVLTRDEFARLYDACVMRPRSGDLLGLAVLIAVATGVRWAEMTGLTWRDVDLRTRTVTVTARNSKTARTRTIAIPDLLVAELTKRRKGTKLDDHVVPVLRLKKSFAAARDSIGLHDLRWHDLRHSAISWWIEEGVPLAEAGRMAGHTTPAMTYRYVSLTDDNARRGAEAMQRLLSDVFLAADADAEAQSADEAKDLHVN